MKSGRGRHTGLVAALAIASLAMGAAACGAEEETEEGDGKQVTGVVEGEPIELGDLRFNVQLTRFLNPADIEDEEYLQGLPAAPLGEDYLAVFMEVENEGDDDLALPSAADMQVEDTTGATYEPVETTSIFALDLGATLPAGEELPAPDTAASSGPIQGSIVLFLVNENVSENRPLELTILADGEEGTVELDI
jgi:hypothetical protein